MGGNTHLKRRVRFLDGVPHADGALIEEAVVVNGQKIPLGESPLKDCLVVKHRAGRLDSWRDNIL